VTGDGGDATHDGEAPGHEGPPTTATIRLRAYAPGDGVQLAAVFFRSVREAARADYSEVQVEAWAPVAADPASFEARAADGRFVVVAVNTVDEIVGYADLEGNGHIDHTYCRPDVVGRGVGSRLYDSLEEQAREAGIDRLFVEASESARRLFARKGFVVRHRQDLVVRGVEIHNYVMEKQLHAEPPPA
jgi:putative acetyltransferase